MEDYLLFVDGSVAPKSNIGYGAYLLIKEDELKNDDLSKKIKIKKFNDTTSTKLELQTLLWAFKEIEFVADRIIVYTDCQNIVTLNERRKKLESKDYKNRKNEYLANHLLYKKFFIYIDRFECEIRKIKGHKQNSQKDLLDSVFSNVDKASRNALRNTVSFIEVLNKEIFINLQNIGNEFRRLFHGRGGNFENLEHITVDLIDYNIFAVFFKETYLESDVIDLLKDFAFKYNLKSVVIQRRYIKPAQNETVYGEISDYIYAYENGLKYKVDLNSNQNIGFFGDMVNGRTFISLISTNKNVLNLFSYTCSFSVCANNGGARQVVNVDMSKSSLSTGRINHQINNLDTNIVKFLPFNILKSWSKIKKFAPYDIVIIDPPSFQKGSFEASRDYEKILKRLSSLCAPQATVLACLNSPELDTKFLIELFSTHAPEFEYVMRLDNSEYYPQIESERALKNLIFKLKSN